jgi:hypothetical protein
MEVLREMDIVGNLEGRELAWAESRVTPGLFELRAGEEGLATLFWEEKYTALAEMGPGRWRFKRVWGLNQREVVLDPVDGRELAAYKPSFLTSGGSLVFPTGRRFSWKNSSFWQSHKIWVDQDDRRLLHFQNAPLNHLPLTIEPGAAQLPEFPLLTTFGAFLLLLAYRDTTKIAAGPQPPQR